jgi:hypothetical protein
MPTMYTRHIDTVFGSRPNWLTGKARSWIRGLNMHFERTMIKMTLAMHFALLKRIKCKVGISLERER